MKLILTLLRTNTKFRYVAIGGSTFLIELLVIYIAQSAGAPGTVAVALSFITGLAISFLLQKVVTFRDKRFHHKIILSQVAIYSLLVAFNFAFTILMVHLFEAHAPVALIRAVTLGITVIWNFYLYKTWIFQRNDQTAV